MQLNQIKQGLGVSETNDKIVAESNKPALVIRKIFLSFKVKNPRKQI